MKGEKIILCIPYVVSLLLTSSSVELFFFQVPDFFYRCWNSLFMLFINAVDDCLKILGWENLVDVEGVSGMSKRIEMILDNLSTGKIIISSVAFIKCPSGLIRKAVIQQ